ncbi:efflux RND transporter periplasmic adaptor subunit [Candidatus Peregrinibacteria bacterium]|nr:efflux RND transporter periplasmic adaptor subunit [Candidatus Peregrinibacteria bacterium]
MKYLRTLTYLTLAVFLLSACSDQNSNAETNVENESVQNEKNTETISVTVQSPADQQAVMLNLTGTVESNAQVSVFPSTSGEVKQVNAQTGDFVEKGDVLIVLGGTNGNDHPNEKQYEIALANYNSAKTGYENTIASMESAVKMAELQLESAKNQTAASYIDLAEFGYTSQAMRGSIGLSRSSLDETVIMNERGLNNIDDSLEDLDEALDDLYETRRDTIDELQDQLDETTDPAARTAIEEQMKSTASTFKTQIDELNNQVDQLENSFDSTRSQGILAENQLMSQLNQLQSQHRSVLVGKDKLVTSMGLNESDMSSDPVRLAIEGVNSSKAQANSAISGAKTQLEIAELNLEMARDQQKNLLVLAPVSGKVSNIDVNTGDIVSPQTMLTRIVNDGAYFAKVSVSNDDANKIERDDKAQVLIGGKYVSVPVRSIDPIADRQTRLVKVTIQLPQIGFRANQTVEIKLPINPASAENGGIYVPLDAVTIGTQNTYVFVVEDGKAHKVNVELGEISGDLVEIKSGLTEDAQLVVEGSRDLVENANVSVTN